jgi:predicted transcriptional regulator
MVDIQNGQAEQISEATVADLTTAIVSAYVSNNNVPPAQLPEIIAAVSSALRERMAGPAVLQPEPQEPAVPVRRSVTREEIVCLECGKRFKSIRRHLQTAHGLEPNEYRQKWGLRPDYPMTAPAYAEKRSELAKSLGLGRKRAEAAPSPKGRRKRRGNGNAEAPATG